MKKILAALLLISGLDAYAQTITLDFTVGILSNASGSAIADGSLFQVIGSTDSVFDAATPDAFVSGNDVILWSGGFDSSTIGMSGAASVVVADLSATHAGNYLIIRWFPTLAAGAVTPGITSYGQFGYASDNSWVAPAAGNTLSYSFLTNSSGAGTWDDSTGYASSVTAVPEPSTYAVIAGIIAMGLILHQRRRSQA